MVPFLAMAAWPLSGWATSREASGGSAPVRVEVRCHVFQSVRDAPLVPGKPTVIRVYADWEAKDGPVEQPELLDATVRIRAGGEELAEMYKTFVRPDLHQRMDSVNATISVNHFGWRPPAGDGRKSIPVEVEVEFVSFETGESYFYDAACPVPALAAAPTLKLDYYFLRTEEWFDDDWDEEDWAPLRQAFENTESGWPGEWTLIEEFGHELMRSSRSYAERTLPVRHIAIRPGGILWYRQFFTRKFEREEALASELYERASKANPDVDIIVGIVPTSYYNGDALGKMYFFSPPDRPDAHFGAHLGGKRVIFVTLEMFGEPSDPSVLTHEIGHFYGLCHTLPVLLRDGSTAPVRVSRPSGPNGCIPRDTLQIEGFNIWRTGDEGENRSMTEGNGTLPMVSNMPVATVMDSGSAYPTSAPDAWRWPANEQYARVMFNLGVLGYYGTSAGTPGEQGSGSPDAPFPGRIGSGPFEQPLRSEHMQAGFAGGWGVDESGGQWHPPLLRTVAASRARAARVPHLVVTGVISGDGEVELDPFRIVERPAGQQASGGNFRLEALGSNGELLHEQSFSPAVVEQSHGLPTEASFFEVALPVNPDIAQVRVSRGGTELVRRIRSASPPALAILSPAPDAQWDGRTPLRWEGSDPDGDSLLYDVDYSPDGGAHWSPIAVQVPLTHLPGLQPGHLALGPAPRIRVTAMDGFHSSTAEQGVRVVGGFRLLAALPGAGDSVAAGDGAVSIQFNRAPNGTGGSAGSFELRDANGTLIPTRIEMDEGGAAALLIPESNLEPGATYEVRVSEGLSDRAGNRVEGVRQWKFHTLPDLRQPRVIGMSPRPGALGVMPQANISIRFDKAMNPGSITSSGILVERAGGGAVRGQWRYDEESVTAIFEPAAPWDERATYTVTVTEGVTDASGNAVRTVSPWTFRIVGAIRPGAR